MKFITRITTQEGHSTNEFDSVDLAIDNIIDEHFNNGRWAYVGTTNFQFSATSRNDATTLLQDAARLRNLLLENDGEDVVVTLTGNLVGGGTISTEQLLEVLVPSLKTAVELVSKKVVDAVETEGSVISDDTTVFEITRDELQDLPAFVEFAQSVVEAISDGETVVVRLV